MDTNYQQAVYDYRRSPDQDAATPARHPVIVVGAGPVGLSAAIDLAQHGQPVVLLDDDCGLSAGSRAICFSKRTLEIFDRLGCGQRMVDKGVSWNVGRVFFREEQVYSFDLLPESGHRRPAFINLQQYYVEGYLVERALELPNIDLRWKNKVVGLSQEAGGVTLMVETPEGSYSLACDYLVACDGSRSPIRGLCGLESKGRTFRDRFLIADVKMKAEFPTERWFWFDPPFHPNQSVLLHRQPDNVWRIDFQLGWDADPVEEKKPEKVIPRIRALLGQDVDFELEWVSVYTFSCLRMERFRHGRILFAGDAAHGVSPFGARGANSGVQDADNLAWKLALVLKGGASPDLLDTYAVERQAAADENILNSTRSTDFITPKSAVSKTFRDAVLRLSKHHEFARRIVNSGRLSMPSVLADSPLNTTDGDEFEGAMVPGAPMADAPVVAATEQQWLTAYAGGTFTGLYFSDRGRVDDKAFESLASLAHGDQPVRTLIIVSQGTDAPAADGLTVLNDEQGLLAQRYDAKPGTFYLIRPDQHVCARWRKLEPELVRQALARATQSAVETNLAEGVPCLALH
ncbi:FAD-dependent oxidoreductase [Noviherbaspirillum sp. CPCC 100848]|uniref:FAD-dependent oxidoreductase n=1 Tax=Noviherbaspirillum album TaxID=3080276 RepID=A0ABU6JIR0_9BURK|nr:FAD-dependent oxidoreductase [Noviherbaspirillum sp. CPCC 100848]MEC4723145.1 FAD-dependent oxidoreductase [Noviherbaspirillum sp. CPCC 100848]